jgi:hypothetical protein
MHEQKICMLRDVLTADCRTGFVVLLAVVAICS